MRSRSFLTAFDEIVAGYNLTGKPPSQPVYLAGLWLYAMVNRVRSSRMFEKASHNRTVGHAVSLALGTAYFRTQAHGRD